MAMKDPKTQNGAAPSARELREGVWEKPTTKPPVATVAPAPLPPTPPAKK
jgi:hypothetical protein